MQNTNFQDDPYLLSRQSLEKKASEDISEKIVAVILFACAFADWFIYPSVATF